MENRHVGYARRSPGALYAWLLLPGLLPILLPGVRRDIPPCSSHVPIFLQSLQYASMCIVQGRALLGLDIAMTTCGAGRVRDSQRCV